MMNLDRKWMNVALCATMGLTVCIVAPGCSNEPEQQVNLAPPPPPPPPAEPPKPSVTPVEQLMVDLNIDPKVVLPEERAPDNDVDRTAVLVFFDAIARGNAEALKPMMPLTDQLELTALIESGEWQKTASKIQSVEIQTGTYEENKCALAVIEVGNGANMTFQPQLWYYHTEEDQPQFEAAPTPPNIMDKLSGDDWIAAWHAILEEEAMLAMRLDEIEEFQQRNLEESKDKPEQEAADSGKGTFRTPSGPPQAPPDPGVPGGR
jgi:hypothetical protein